MTIAGSDNGGAGATGEKPAGAPDQAGADAAKLAADAAAKTEADKATTDAKALADKAAADEAAKQTPEQKAAAEKLAAETKSADEAKAKTAAAEKARKDAEAFTFKAADGAKVDEATAADIRKLAGDLALTQEQAQRLYDHQLAASAAEAAAGQERLKTATVQWEKDVQADKDLGGSNFEQTKEHCRRAIDALGDPELKAALDSTGYGNFPPLVRMLAKAGKLMGDGKIIPADGPANPAKRPADLLFDAPIAP